MGKHIQHIPGGYAGLCSALNYSEAVKTVPASLLATLRDSDMTGSWLAITSAVSRLQTGTYHIPRCAGAEKSLND